MDVAHWSAPFWSGFTFIVRLILMGGFAATGIAGVILWEDAQDDWYRVMFAQFLVLVSLAGMLLSWFAVRA